MRTTFAPTFSEGPADIVADPADLPAPIGIRAPRRMRVDLETVELTGKLANGATYRYWTFNRQVPGPFIRVRVGDTVEVHLTNSHDSRAFHNVNFHAVTGPGGGGGATEAAPGENRGFEFQAGVNFVQGKASTVGWLAPVVSAGFADRR